MGKTRLRKKTINPAEILRKKCVTLAKQIARLLAGEECEHCHKKKIDGWQMQGSHIYPEGIYRSMSADVDNILCLCAACHTGGFWKNSTKSSWHDDPVYFVGWFETKYPERALILKKRANQPPVQADEWYWTKKLLQLKKTLKDLEDSFKSDCP